MQDFISCLFLNSNQSGFSPLTEQSFPRKAHCTVDYVLIRVIIITAELNLFLRWQIAVTRGLRRRGGGKSESVFGCVWICGLNKMICLFVILLITKLILVQRFLAREAVSLWL